MFSSNARYSQSYEDLPEQEDLACDICGKDAQTLTTLPTDTEGAESLDVCATCLLADVESKALDACEHGDVCTDERICLDCSKDMTETLASAAYDQAKDFRKYGGLP